MSPTPGTLRRSLRVRDDLWTRAAAKAARTGTTLTAVIVAALEEYVREVDASWHEQWCADPSDVNADGLCMVCGNQRPALKEYVEGEGDE